MAFPKTWKEPTRVEFRSLGPWSATQFALTRSKLWTHPHHPLVYNSPRFHYYILMTATTSLSRRVFLLSRFRHSSRVLARSKPSLRRLQASLASQQPTFTPPPPPPTSSHRTVDSSAGAPSYRVPEQRRNEWQAPPQGRSYVWMIATLFFFLLHHIPHV